MIRKAIKLVLQNPDETQYAEFVDQLCGIYHDAKCVRDKMAAYMAACQVPKGRFAVNAVFKTQDSAGTISPSRYFCSTCRDC